MCGLAGRAGSLGMRWDAGMLRDVLVLGSALFVWTRCNIADKREREGHSPLLPRGFRGANPQWGLEGEWAQRQSPIKAGWPVFPRRGPGVSRCRQGCRCALPAAGREHMERIWV